MQEDRDQDAKAASAGDEPIPFPSLDDDRVAGAAVKLQFDGFKRRVCQAIDANAQNFLSGPSEQLNMRLVGPSAEDMAQTAGMIRAMYRQGASDGADFVRRVTGRELARQAAAARQQEDEQKKLAAAKIRGKKPARKARR